MSVENENSLVQLGTVAPDDVPDVDPREKLKAGLVRWLLIGFSAFVLWSNSFSMMTTIQQGGIFLSFLLALIFLIYPTNKKVKAFRFIDYALSVAGAAVGLYTYLTAERIALTNLEATTLDYLMGGLAVLLVMEAARRAVSPWMAILPGIFLLYALYGNFIPGIFGHAGFTLKRLMLRMYLVDEGIYGISLQVAATYIFLFVIFGAFLNETGAGQFFTEVSIRLAGKSVGGPAKVATISSALMGTISGSAAANVATTGAFTIPLMKKVGFRPAFAGAVEATASTGGMIMPPVMGAAAFLMAQYLSVPYTKIMTAAIIPAVLYYISIYAWVHFEALRVGLRRLTQGELPVLHDWQRRLLLVAPLIVIIYGLLSGRTAIFSAFMGILACIVASMLQKQRMGVSGFLRALEKGAKDGISASAAAVAAGILVGVIGMTSFGQVLTMNIMKLSFNNLFVALILAALSSLIMSMGLPATACYIISATVMGPALVRMGAMPIAAHLFVFYFACLSNITPPVAIASYTAAGIAGANPFDVGWQAVRIALPGFIIPFLFVFNPVLVAQFSSPAELVVPVITATIGTVCLAIAGAGYLFRPLRTWQRLAYVCAALMLIDPGLVTDLIGVGLLAAMLVRDYTAYRSQSLGTPTGN